MKKASVEMTVGVFVLVGLAAILYLAIQLGEMDLLGRDSYTVNARFQSVSGLKVGARVEVSGVGVGKVTNIHLDHKSLAAIVQMEINRDLTLSDDSIASVRTAGLIGDRYIKLSPGGSDINLEPGEMIVDTESAVDIEELIGKYVFGDVKK
jgi:phospholipid/cholesterol/gamma-HCH transport system substrate-binding protein